MRSRLVAVGAAVALSAVSACSVSVSGHPSSLRSSAPATDRAATSSPPPAKATPQAAVAVHASLFQADGRTYGVGMPIIVRFDKAVTDASAFEQAATVQLDGQRTDGAWYWQRGAPASGYAMEAHYRLRNYWPAHSHIEVNLPIGGLSAGTGRAYDDSLTLSIDIGAAHVSTVYQSGHPHMDVVSDGTLVGTLPVSLGSADWPTYSGVKVVEEFDRVQNMEGTPVPWSVRVTNSGEFVHAASWNGRIGSANTSHGCTNLSVADAQWFYKFSRLGDVVTYPDAQGPRMKVWDGLGDWNVPWTEWRAGGVF